MPAIIFSVLILFAVPVMAGDSFSCLNDSINGRQDDFCQGQGENNRCVGIRRGLENSAKKEICLKGMAPDCQLWGYKQNSQPQWVSVAAAHITKFVDCVVEMYGVKPMEKEGGRGLMGVLERMEDSETGDIREEAMARALEDEAFLELLKSFNDGSAVFELPPGEVLVRTLKGEKMHDIIGNSPLAKKLSVNELLSLKQAGDNPLTIDGAGALAEKEGKGTNPSQEGGGFELSDGALAKLSLPQKRRNGNALDLAQRRHRKEREQEKNPAPEIPAWVGAPGPSVLEVSANKALDRKQVTKAKAGRRVLLNPYSLGLDLNLFERVTGAYERRLEGLLGTDFYIDQAKSLDHDASDLVEHSATFSIR